MPRKKKEPKKIFSDEAIQNSIAFAQVLKKIHTRLLMENGGKLPEAFNKPKSEQGEEIKGK